MAIIIQTASAQNYVLDTFLYVTVYPNPVGVNQVTTVIYQMDKLSPTATGIRGGDHFQGFTITITKPDGTTQTLGPSEAWSMSGNFLEWTPTQVGTYTFVAHFPGQTIFSGPSSTGSYPDNTDLVFKPSDSGAFSLTVQEDPIEPYADNPLPTGYWERPVNAENKGWYQIMDNWLMEGYNYDSRSFSGYGAFAPYTSAPNSAHILWTAERWFGGIAGGQFGDKAYYSGLSYEQPYEPLILQGRIIYSDHGPSETNKFGTRCISLYTGEEIWYLDDVNINFAQLYAIENPNEHGLIAHLWSMSGSTWKMYDGMTGEWILDIANVSSGSSASRTFGPEGEILTWTTGGSGSNGYMILWNSTKALEGGSAITNDRYEPDPRDSPIDGRLGIQYNVSIGSAPRSIQQVNVGFEDVVVTASTDATSYPYVFTLACFDAFTGQKLWEKDITDLWAQSIRMPRDRSAIREGIILMFDQAKRILHAYDVRTGNEAWKTEPYPEGWSYFTRTYNIAYGRAYTVGYDGTIRAFDAETGEIEWDYFYGSSGYETPYGTWPTYASPTIADHKIFVSNDDHSSDSVLWRGGRLMAVSTETGDLVWDISGWFRIPAVADGILTSQNSLDGKLYGFGKGPSKTTVDAPKVGITLGQSVIIEGTVTDQSPGAKDTPAISEEDMRAWMEYIYMQKPFPADATGVEVTIDVIDSNGNYRNIGTATSDVTGKFALMWEPDISGQYTVVATFAGSESYGGSFDQTYLGVVDAPDATTPPEATPAPMTDTYVVGTGIAVIAAVAVGVLLLLRKK